MTVRHISYILEVFRYGHFPWGVRCCACCVVLLGHVIREGPSVLKC